METFGIIVVLAVIGIGYLLLRRGINVAGNALERKVRSGAATNEDELLKTVLVFKTSATLQVVRQAIENNVVVKGDIWAGKMRVRQDSERGIEWEIGSVAVGGGVQVQLVYHVENGITVGQFVVVRQVTKGGVSPFIKKLTELRNQVITAFKSVDPAVQITTEAQNVNRKTS